jgi:hypothetical protein
MTVLVLDKRHFSSFYDVRRIDRGIND